MTGKVVEGTSKTVDHCSFCGKSEHHVRKLVAGPHVFICDECVELTMVLVREEGASFYLRSPNEYRELAEDNVRIAEAAGIPRDKGSGCRNSNLAPLAEEAAGRQLS